MDIGLIFSEFIVQFVFPIIGAVLGVLLLILARKADQKLDVDIFERRIDIFEALAMDAVNYAEELAADKAKSRGKITGRAKLDEAIAWLMTRAPELTKEESEAWVLSALKWAGLGASAKNDEPEA